MTDCDGCIEEIADCAAVLAALMRRLGAAEVELSAQERAAFTSDMAVAFMPGEAEGSLRVVVRDVNAADLCEREVPCGS